ncbi:hypothetical protein [Neorhizobium sp. AL 9.2.2]|uniref:hypothetical protein n=1 Tax=Neorhizobium sp. AL 9.2.2 TaxID=2712894 RepID=UPI001574C31D|nr:hypothetical protein [Neorhizobium sp. AL 9.2.2]NSY15783.1 hypothetical protein [Neorhizobium sp. AL 9.2.2]
MSANDGLIAGGRLNLLSLSGQLQLAYGSSIFAETIGQILQIPRNDGELLADYAERLTVAVQSMSADEVAALEKTLSQLVKGMSVSLLAEILKNPAGLDAARLILSLEAALVADSDQAENAAVSSYRQNEIASLPKDGATPSPATRPGVPPAVAQSGPSLPGPTLPGPSSAAPSALQPSTPSPASPAVPLPGSSPDTASTENPRPSPAALPDIGAKSQSVTSPAPGATPPAPGATPPAPSATPPAPSAAPPAPSAAAPAIAPFSPPTSGSASAAPDTKVPGTELQKPQLLPPLVDLQEEPTREAILARPMPVRTEGLSTATADLQSKTAMPSPAVPNAVPVKPDASPVPAQGVSIAAADAKPMPQVLPGALPQTAVPGIATVTNTGALVAAVIDAFDTDMKIPIGDAEPAPVAKPAVEWPSNLAQLVSAIAPSALQAALLATGAPVDNSTAALFKNLFGGGGSGAVAHTGGQGQPAAGAPDIDAMHTAGITHAEDDLLRIANERHTTAAKASGAPEAAPEPDIEPMPVPLPLVQREAIGLPFVPYPMADDEPRRENRKTQPVTAIDEDGEGDHSQGQAFDHPDDGNEPSDDDNPGSEEAASPDASADDRRPNELYWRMAGWA